LFLAHSFGLPVVAADVGSLKDDIAEGTNGFLFQPEDPVDLANAIQKYFTSDLYKNLSSRREEIKNYAARRHSWDVVADTTMNVYAGLLRTSLPGESLSPEVPSTSRGASS
jgi:glycosyltransferase involved in cell wall biosynthesis